MFCDFSVMFDFSVTEVGPGPSMSYVILIWDNAAGGKHVGEPMLQLVEPGSPKLRIRRT